MKNFDRIKAAIDDSSVDSVDKMMLVDYFAGIPDDSLKNIADLFEKKGDWVAKFNDNRKKKQEALQSGNRALWKEIMEEEKKYLSEMTYGLD